MAYSGRVILREAKVSDIPAFIAISEASFQKDTHTQLKGAAQSPPITPSQYMSQGAHEFFLSRFDRPGTTITAATMSKPSNDNTIVGFLIAGSRGTFSAQTPYDEIVRNRGDPPSSPGPSTASGTVRYLARITDKSMKDWMEWFHTPPAGSSEAQCHFIISMSVHPDYQAMGVGTVLMGELARKCDEANVPCWVQSSDAAFHFYEKNGFVELGRLELDLDRFNVAEDGSVIEMPLGDDGGDMRQWGRYCWRYMERPPGR